MFVGMGANGAGGDYNLENSLRFRKSAGASLSRTPTVTGNRKTWTFSCWVKRGELGSLTNRLIQAGANGSNDTAIYFAADSLSFFTRTSTSLVGYLISTPLYRDPSAWYHVVVAYDSTQATNSNRVKMYINGEQITSFSTETYPPQNTDSYFNTNANLHTIGGATDNTATFYLDGYLTEINSIDGQALTPSDFGETNSNTGVWQPIEYTGTYGTNGFYLPFKPTTQATGFNTVLYTGNGGTQTIDNIGFSPDLVWLKNRGTTNSHYLSDTVRGNEKAVNSNTNAAEFNYTPYGGLSFVPNGFYVETGTSNVFNTSGNNFVAWCWDAGSGSPVSNTDGTITSTVKANPATGFSVVSYTGTSAIATIGHGLGVAPKIIIVKNRTVGGDPAGDWWTWHTSIGINQYIRLNLTNAVGSSSTIWNNTLPTSSVFSVGNDFANTSASNYVAYCFSDVAGYQKIGTYTGNGISNGPTVTTGFRPAFIMMKSTNAIDSWAMVDNRRHPSNDPLCPTLLADSSTAELTAYPCVDFLDDGFKLVGNPDIHNYSGRNYIYIAIADTTDAQFNFDASGNHNNWEANNINSNASGDTTYDIMTDVPTLTDEDTANYAVINPIATQADLGSGNTVTDGNLKYTAGPTNSDLIRRTATIGTVGKFYAEYTCLAPTNSGALQNYPRIGSAELQSTGGGTFFAYDQTGQIYNGSWTSGYATFTTGDVIGVAFDNTVTPTACSFYKNGTLIASVTNTISDLYKPTLTFSFHARYNASWAINFGQRPFKYTPPAGYLKLNTFNLPDSSIVDGSDNFNPVLYTGTGEIHNITGVGFQPDFTIVKSRSNVASHNVYDSVRGIKKILITNGTDAEVTELDNAGLDSFDTDGFTIDALEWLADVNILGRTYVAWNWKAGGTAVSNTDGTITTQVSANPTAGFSVMTYTGTGVAGSIGHGLGVVPKLYIIKQRTDAGNNWIFQTTAVDGSLDYLFLNSTAAKGDSGDALPTSSVINISGNNDVNGSGDGIVAYSFADVEGYSKIGRYTGNGSADGPFVYTGFRPAWILEKNATNGSYGWLMWDSTRATYNMVTKFLVANSTGAEVDTGGAQGANIDILSNGFKIRDPNPAWNENGATFIYMAFAENPFKNSLAR